MVTIRSFHLLTILSILALVCFATNDRDFVAARKHGSLRRRDGSLGPRRDGQVLMYADGRLMSCLNLNLAYTDSANKESLPRHELSFDPGRRC